LVFLAPMPDSVKNVIAVQWRTSTALAVGITTIGATVLFLARLSNFKTSLRKAYILLSAGLILYSLALLQLPIIGFFDQWGTLWWANSGLVVLPFVFATGMIYAGMRKFAQLLGIRSIVTSFWFVVGVAIGAAILSYFAGHYLAVYRETIGTDGYAAITAWSTAYIFFAALLCRDILRRIGPSYKKPLKWLLIALIGLLVSGLHQYLIVFFMNNEMWYTAYGVQFVPFIISGLLFLRAGYVFNLLSIDTSTTTAALEQVTGPAQDEDYTLSIVAIAQLASRREEIDSTLDDLRLVTANLQPGEKFSPEDKQELVVIYKKIEEYLLHNDPLRSFSLHELRNQVTPAFRVVLQNQAPLLNTTTL
jgi:hypothetical protein